MDTQLELELAKGQRPIRMIGRDRQLKGLDAQDYAVEAHQAPRRSATDRSPQDGTSSQSGI
ncbi:hypothetical protein [Phaffia rhodozyma]|uniref:Uncharacterized protein n=1 Tax=Phaffia rhodozyma TaxID=264483 RepID=A0A0F7STE8_PHARH|nr:hypothetical protein [Phaffia rhodozyma]